MTHGHSETTHGLVVHTHNHTFDVGPVRKGVTRPGIKGNSHTRASTGFGCTRGRGIALTRAATLQISEDGVSIHTRACGASEVDGDTIGWAIGRSVTHAKIHLHVEGFNESTVVNVR